MRAGDYLDYVGALKEIESARLRRRWATWALGRVGLTEVASRRIGELSGGMQRRLSIAQALLGGPDLLILDEPLAGLDAEHRATTTSLLATLAESATVVCATHHADELATVCRRAVVVDRGAPVFVGTPATLAGQARGRVWETGAADPRGISRAVGPDRFRTVGDSIPAGCAPAEPTVADGYLALVRRT